MPSPYRFLAALLASAPFALGACGAAWPADTYCQSGPKYGTTCMSLTDVRAQSGQRPPPANEPAWYAARPLGPPQPNANRGKSAPPQNWAPPTYVDAGAY